MNNSWYFTFDGAPLAESLQQKLQQFGILNDVPATYLPNSAEVQFVKDFFTADGYPGLGDDVPYADMAYPYLFPAIAPWYDATAIPAIQVEMAPKFRQTACEAALSWLCNLTAAADPSAASECRKTFHGLAFQEDVCGSSHLFAFPDTCIATSAHGRAAVVLIADSYWNNADWEKQGGTPLYARQQAMFQLWCWQRYAEKTGYQVEAPETAYVVRICGNLAVDCTIRTVRYNPREAQAMVERICKARNAEPQKGLYWKRCIEPMKTWSEKIENEAFVTENQDLYDLILEHMQTRSTRKAFERKAKEITEQMEGIAVKLASYIPAGEIQGQYELPDGTICAVTHQKKRTGEKRITPDLVRSFFPQLDDCITASTVERTTVTIETL